MKVLERNVGKEGFKYLTKYLNIGHGLSRGLLDVLERERGVVVTYFMYRQTIWQPLSSKLVNRFRQLSEKHL